MPDEPTAQTAGPGSPHPGPPDGTPTPATAPKPTSATAPKQPKRKKITAFVLAALGLAMLLIAFILYPKTPEPSTPGFSVLVITSNVPVVAIGYAVSQPSAATAKIKVTVSLPFGTRAGTTTLKLQLPLGTTFADCRPPGCRVIHQGRLVGTYWTEPLTFTFAGGVFQATTTFMVRAHHFGVSFNGRTASAVVPQVNYLGPENPEPVLLAGYVIPSADSYDWSSFPPAGITGYGAAWQESLPYGNTASRVATGTNHGAQSNDTTLALIVGTLLGLGGGALMSAVQEFLNARD